MIARSVDIGGIVAHHCFDFLFIIYTYIYYDMKTFTTTNEVFNIQIANFNISLASRLLKLRAFAYHTYVLVLAVKVFVCLS